MGLSIVWMLLTACSGTGEPAADAPAKDAPAATAEDAVPAPPDVAEAPSDAMALPSGVKLKILTPGAGTDKPGKFSRVTTKYTTWTRDGKMIESNETKGRVGGFAMSEVPIPFLRDTLEQLTSGGKARVWIPAEQGYKGKNEGAITADVELTSVVNPPAAPPDVAAPPADATKTASGLAYKVLTPGTGDETPTKWARVTLTFTGWQTDGTVVESTVARGRPQMFKLTENAMPGWVEGVTMMRRHEKMRLWLPENLAYNGAPDKPKGMLVYDVELMSFDNPVPPPDDVAAAPADAKKTASGLAYKVLKKGSGGKKPTATSIVEVNYTGWTTDGNMFDSTTKRNKPMRFATTQVIPGWTEGLQLMTVGETDRFWVPVELAYNNQPGKPAGMLVFDVELVSVAEGPATPTDVAAAPADAEKTPSGVSIKVLKKGAGSDKPVEGAKVVVHYTGWTATDGKMFDSTLVRGEPAKFPLGGAVPKGLVESIQTMTKGEKARAWIPQELAQSNRPGGPQGLLVFDLELLEFTNPPPPIPAPPDVAAAPADATKTASGLAYKVLTKGTGTEHPSPTSRVKVDYTGWTTDGKMFDSSVQRGEPASFSVGGVIKGWTEALQLMVVGDKYRVWIPVELAYNNQPGKPAGMLVFDVDLKEIQAAGPPRRPGGPGMPGLALPPEHPAPPPAPR